MRVTNIATYRKYSSSVNSVHSKLNKSMNKVSSGKAYENSAENPLAYFEGKKMDNQFQDTETKIELIADLKNRLYQQEAGATSIQKTLSEARTKVQYIINGTNNSITQENATLEIIRNDLLQKAHTMVNDLNAQYQDFFVFGGNDISTAPFTLSADGKVLTYNHAFPGEDEVTSITMTLNNDGTYTFGGTVGSGENARELGTEEECLDKLIQSMSEQGRVDIGYGTIRDTATLMDTYTGGINLLTGISSDKVLAYMETNSNNSTNPDNTSNTTDDFKKNLLDRLLKSPLGLVGQAICTIENYQEDGNSGEFTNKMGDIMSEMTQTEQQVATVYSDLGNKYSLLESTETKLKSVSALLQEQYTEKLGADPYEAITEMYSHQYAYSAALQLSSKLFQSSLFDFVR